MRETLLVVDPDPAVAARAEAAVADRGTIAVRWSPDRAAAADAVAEVEADAVLLDVDPDAAAPMAVCVALTERWRAVPVVVLATRGTMELAVEAMRAGAADFLTKPVPDDVLRLAIDRALAARRLRRELRELRRRVRLAQGFGEMLGESLPMKQLYRLLARVADVDSSVLVFGESGTGKELVARALHARSARRDLPFVALNCAAMPEPLLESELFGHVRGAFTDARADRRGLLVEAGAGTLFLDEIGDMPPGLQAKLLRVIQERRVRPIGENREVPVAARFVAATHRDLEVEAAAGRFRSDLLYRLDVIRLELPPLRDRGGDVLLLAQHFLERVARRHSRPVTGFTSDTLRALSAYPWPGNVRELHNCVERAVVLADGEMVAVQDLPAKVRHTRERPAPAASPDSLTSLATVERAHIERVLAACGGSRVRAAQVLAIDRKTLYRKLAAYRET